MNCFDVTTFILILVKVETKTTNLDCRHQNKHVCVVNKFCVWAQQFQESVSSYRRLGTKSLIGWTDVSFTRSSNFTFSYEKMQEIKRRNLDSCCRVEHKVNRLRPCRPPPSIPLSIGDFPPRLW